MKQFLLDYGELVAVFLSPLVAFAITIYYQNRQEKRKAKQTLFLTLMAHRKKKPPTVEFAHALNTIDVVFQDNKEVRAAWKEYHSSLYDQNRLINESNSLLLDMLSAMADDLNYKKLSQTEIDKYYTPVYHDNQSRNADEATMELIRILQRSKSIGESLPRKKWKKKKEILKKEGRYY